MRRSRLTGQSKSKDTEFGWYFAGEPMNKRHSGSGRIRLVRYRPEMEPCAHSRCPSPTPITEKAPCSCGAHYELHPNGTRSSSPNNSDLFGHGPVRVCCGGCHAIRRERESSPQAENAPCSCNNHCELHLNDTRPFTSSSSQSSRSDSIINCCGNCYAARYGRHPMNTHPTTPNSSDLSDHEPPRRRRSGHRIPKREPDHSLQVEQCHCEVHGPPGAPTMPSPRFTSARAASMGAPRPIPVIHHHRCRKASYCETHPESCRASAPRPKSAPTLMRAPRFSEAQPSGKPRRSSRARSAQIKCTCSPVASPKQPPPTRPVSSAKATSPKPEIQRCSCFYMDGYHTGDSGYYTPYDDDTASDTSVLAMSDEEPDRDVDEAFCPAYHRCRPRFECGVGWICGRN
ncbi:hypothetical protein N7475_004784 [Penicillium sp. IBT 31633x]|nr:hypothetical protein N7475_004784 [Penicillium sp. IBT 31633x]